MDPNTHMYYCLFCFGNCLGEQKKDYIVVDSKKFGLVHPICACSNKKNHSSIAENAFCLENILNEKSLNKNCDLYQIPGNIVYRNDMQEKFIKPIKDLHNILLEAYVRILHGTGSGILRQLIRQYLQTVPSVSSAHDEHVQFGGAGITVVELS
jgi:hypothetical protein